MARRFRCWRARSSLICGSLGRALDPAVPRPVVVGAVTAALAVRLVELVVVRDQVGEREAVVGGDEVDAGVGPPTAGLVQVRGAGDPRSELAEAAGPAAPDVADVVAVATVPLRPRRREVPDLVAALPHVPRLGDQLDLVDHRVLLDEVEERREPVDVVQFAGERGREVEPEPVDVHLLDPVPEAVHDQLEHVGMAHVQAVAGARVVDVPARIGRVEPVVRLVVEPPERQHGTARAPLGGVVVDHVEDHLDARLVQGLHHHLELLHLLAAVTARRVGVVGSEEADRVVPPVVAEAQFDQTLVVARTGAPA